MISPGLHHSESFSITAGYYRQGRLSIALTMLHCLLTGGVRLNTAQYYQYCTDYMQVIILSICSLLILYSVWVYRRSRIAVPGIQGLEVSDCPP